jgi:Zn-dependent peptidase ImmA (M78 family)
MSGLQTRSRSRDPSTCSRDRRYLETVEHDPDLAGIAASGSSHWDWQRRSWIISLNPDEPATRNRFTLIHEYKHIIDHGSSGIHQTKASIRPLQEIVADYFAGCVLMPKRLLKAAYCDGIQRPADLAELFDVSEAAVHVRLDQIGLTEQVPRTQPTYRYQARRAKLSRRYYRSSWPFGPARLEQSRLAS